jgi:hypothetical protein
MRLPATRAPRIRTPNTDAICGHFRIIVSLSRLVARSWRR